VAIGVEVARRWRSAIPRNRRQKDAALILAVLEKPDYALACLRVLPDEISLAIGIEIRLRDGRRGDAHAAHEWIRIAGAVVDPHWHRRNVRIRRASDGDVVAEHMTGRRQRREGRIRRHAR
jgi:hypothetical protein